MTLERIMTDYKNPTKYLDTVLARNPSLMLYLKECVRFGWSTEKECLAIRKQIFDSKPVSSLVGAENFRHKDLRSLYARK